MSAANIQSQISHNLIDSELTVIKKIISRKIHEDTFLKLNLKKKSSN